MKNYLKAIGLTVALVVFVLTLTASIIFLKEYEVVHFQFNESTKIENVNHVSDAESYKNDSIICVSRNQRIPGEYYNGMNVDTLWHIESNYADYGVKKGEDATRRLVIDVTDWLDEGTIMANVNTEFRFAKVRNKKWF